MWIGSHKLIKNVHTPEYVNEYIKEKVAEITQQLKQELADRCTVTLDTSRHSEACYLTIKNHWKEIRISFRNHDGSENHYDYVVYLYRYRTWDKCEKEFIRKTFPKILIELEKTPQT